MKKFLKSINSRILKTRRKILHLSYKHLSDFSWVAGFFLFSGDISKKTLRQTRKLERVLSSFDTENMFVGPFLGFDKGVINFLKSAKDNGKNNFMILSSAPPLRVNFKAEVLKDKIIQLPELFEKEHFHAFTGLKGIKNEVDIKNIKMFYFEELDLLEQLYPFAKIEHLLEYLFYADKIANSIKLNPKIKKVFLWNSYIVLHKVIEKKCDKKKIYHLEFGQIPNTLSIDRNGQLNKSSLNMIDFLGDYNTIRRKNYPIKKETTESLLMLKKTGDNRNNPRSNLNELKKIHFEDPNPIIFLAGQNDLESGLHDKSPELKKLSPLFNSSLDAFMYLRKLSEELKFNLIYKPHPNCYESEVKKISELTLSRNIQVTDYENINELIDLSSLIITSVSSVSFISLIRERPIFTLGNNELAKKNLCFECTTKDKLLNNLNYFLHDRQRFNTLHSTKKQNWLIFYEIFIESKYLINLSRFNNNHKKEYDNLGMTLMNFLKTYL